jgi:tetratricopeptide (TPR) repeat protein
MQRGDSAAAELALARYAELAQSRRLRIAGRHVDRLRAQRDLHAGLLKHAEERFEALAEQARQLSITHWELYYGAQRSALKRERTGIRRAPVAANAVMGPHWLEQLPTMRVRRVQYALKQTESAVARHELGVLAEGGFAALTSDPFSLSTLVQLVAPAIALNERQHARTLCALLEPHADLIALSPFTFSYGSVSQYLGRLCAYLGRRREAREYLERAIAINARTGHELERLRSCLALADLFCDQRGLQARARSLATEVRETALQIGSEPLERSAKRLLSRMPAPSSEGRAPRRKSLRAAP